LLRPVAAITGSGCADGTARLPHHQRCGIRSRNQCGLAFDTAQDLAAVHDSFSFDLSRVNGRHPRTLPIPATDVIDRQGEIRWAFVSSDYTAGAEPTDILAQRHASFLSNDVAPP
jgi:hypothetical protein